MMVSDFFFWRSIKSPTYEIDLAQSSYSISLTFYFIQFPAFANSKNYPRLRNFVVTERRRRSTVTKAFTKQTGGDWVVMKSKRLKKR